jgi:hypothetical protein
MYESSEYDNLRVLMGEIAGGIMIILGIILIALSFALGLSKPIYSLSVLF